MITEQPQGTSSMLFRASICFGVIKQLDQILDFEHYKKRIGLQESNFEKLNTFVVKFLFAMQSSSKSWNFSNTIHYLLTVSFVNNFLYAI